MSVRCLYMARGRLWNFFDVVSHVLPTRRALQWYALLRVNVLFRYLQESPTLDKISVRAIVLAARRGSGVLPQVSAFLLLLVLVVLPPTLACVVVCSVCAADLAHGVRINLHYRNAVW